MQTAGYSPNPSLVLTVLAACAPFGVSNEQEEPMANIDDLRRLDAEVRVAECLAIRGLAESVRMAIRELPSESRLGLLFLRHADGLELAAGERVMDIEEGLLVFTAELWDGEER
jgi:hypothetical protein